MMGYCEICQREQEQAEDEEYGAAVCHKCGHDLVHGVHVDDQFYDEMLNDGWADDGYSL